MTHEKADYDKETKTLFITVDHDRTDPDFKSKFWDEDPQLQIINLLKDIKSLLEKTEAKTAPYHTGPMAVKIPSPVPLLPDSDSKAPQSDDSVS